MIKIIVDAMGGDNAPYAPVAGAAQAAEKDKELYIVFTGRRAEIEEELKKCRLDKARYEIVDCPDVIGMNDSPTSAVRRRQSSLMRAFELLKTEGDACAVVTAGSTGAAIVGGQLILGRMNGVKRPALCPAIPNSRGGFTLLLDCGANAECRPAMLCQFAVLGTVYATAGFGVENPRVGLLNNGTEEHKGDTLRHEAYKLLSGMKGINFIGNVEGRDIVLGDVDVVVADGFSGNVALKAMEGCGKLMFGSLKKQIKSSLKSRIGYLFMKKSLNAMRDELDFDKTGGALLLGLVKPVIKSHGSSKPVTIANSVANAANIHRGGLIPAVSGLLSIADPDNATESANDD